MSLVKHDRGVLSVDREDDPFAGETDNAILLYRAIEKDGRVEGGRERREGQRWKDILWSTERSGGGRDDVFTDRRHKSTSSRARIRSTENVFIRT